MLFCFYSVKTVFQLLIQKKTHRREREGERDDECEKIMILWAELNISSWAEANTNCVLRTHTRYFLCVHTFV